MRHPRRATPSPEPEIHRITDARRSQAEDQHDRIVKYTVSMSIRMVCLVLALVVTGPFRWVFIAGAIVLPYVAVVIANASREQAPPAPDTWAVGPPALGAGSEDPSGHGDAPPEWPSDSRGEP